MCGIVGVIGSNDWYEYDKFMRDALVVDTVRGPHSTGIFTVDQEGTRTLFKRPCTGAQLAFSKVFDDMTPSAIKDRPLFMCGHNRWATRGEINEANAHPFNHGEIIGVHNGTLNGYQGLKAPDGAKSVEDAFDTDSETIFYTLDNIDDYKPMLSELNGSFTLVWHDAGDNCVRIVRNSERPLFFAKVKNYDTLVFASEKGIIEYCMGRRKANIDGEIKSLPVGEVHRFDLNKTNRKELIKPHVQKVSLRTVTTYYGNGYYYSSRGYNNTENSGNNWREHKSTYKKSNNLPKEKGNRNPFSLVTTKYTANEFLSHLNLDKDKELFCEVLEYKNPSGPNKMGEVIGLCSQGSKDFIVRAFLTKTQMHNVNLKEAVYFMGPASITTLIDGVEGIMLRGAETCVFNEDFDFLVKPESFLKKSKDSKTTLLEDLESLEELRESATSYSISIELRKEMDTALGSDEPDDCVATLRGPRGIYIPKSEWYHLTEDGCSLCHRTIDPMDAELVEWEDDVTPVCHHCQGIDVH